EIVSQSLTRHSVDIWDASHRYPLYILEKSGIDSNHALIELGDRFNLKLKILGIKDARAVTKQYASLARSSKNPPKSLETRHTRLTLQELKDRPAEKSDLLGNEFTIRLRGATAADLTTFRTQIDKIGNFYGLQRFGSERMVSHLVGKELIRR